MNALLIVWVANLYEPLSGFVVPPRAPEVLDLEGGLRFIGPRSEGLLNKLVSLYAMMFGCFLAAVGLTKGFPPIRGRVDLGWLALLPAGLIIAVTSAFVATIS